MPDVQTAIGWRGREVVDRDGDEVGTISDIYLDAETDQPEWATVKAGMMGTKKVLVPLRDAESEGDRVRVPYDKGQVKDAPSVDLDQELSQQAEAQLYSHYGLRYEREESSTGLPAQEQRSAQEQVEGRTAGIEGGRGEQADREPGDEQATGELDEPPWAGDREERGDRERAGAGHSEAGTAAAEDELDVVKRTRPRGRVRLRKYIVTDEVQTTVPVRREEVRVEHEPVSEEDAGREEALRPGEQEVTLHEEEPVVEKRAAPEDREQ